MWLDGDRNDMSLYPIRHPEMIIVPPITAPRRVYCPDSLSRTTGMGSDRQGRHIGHIGVTWTEMKCALEVQNHLSLVPSMFEKHDAVIKQSQGDQTHVGRFLYLEGHEYLMCVCVWHVYLNCIAHAGTLHNALTAAP